MFPYNYHTHSNFSDGSDHPSVYVEEAIRQGFRAIGFSEHAPLPSGRYYTMNADRMDEYVRTIRTLAEEKKGIIEVYLSLEVDFIPGFSNSFKYFREKYGTDYLIGSVHLVKNISNDRFWFIDGGDSGLYDKGLEEVFEGNIRKGVTAYYEQVANMIKKEKPDILGHLDKIKMNNKNRYFTEDEPWYKKLVSGVMKEILLSGTIVEVNTRGIYKKRGNELFPGIEILKQLYKNKIPVTISSDAHKPAEISGAFNETLLILKDVGFNKILIFDKKSWIGVNI